MQHESFLVGQLLPQTGSHTIFVSVILLNCRKMRRFTEIGHCRGAVPSFVGNKMHRLGYKRNAMQLAKQLTFANVSVVIHMAQHFVKHYEGMNFDITKARNDRFECNEDSNRVCQEDQAK